MGATPTRVERARNLVNTSVDDMKSGLWAYTSHEDLQVLRTALLIANKRGEKTKAKILRTKISKLEKSVSMSMTMGATPTPFDAQEKGEQQVQYVVQIKTSVIRQVEFIDMPNLSAAEIEEYAKGLAAMEVGSFDESEILLVEKHPTMPASDADWSCYHCCFPNSSGAALCINCRKPRR